MYKGKMLAAVVPAYKEETQILRVIDSMPDYVDRIVVVDDCSPDRTGEIVSQRSQTDARVVLLRHAENQGVGGAIASGYEWSRDNGMDAAVVMAGDGQMDPSDMPPLLDAVFDDGVNYAKGNRLWHPDAFRLVPKVRFFGNSILSLLTKIASGYWHVADSQTGYTVADKDVLHRLDWQKMYKRYGQPNDLLIKLNIEGFRVRDIRIRPVYNVGEISGIKVSRVLFTISLLLLRGFFSRLWIKYVVRDFHPLVFFYAFAASQLLLFIGLLIRVGLVWYAEGAAPPMSSMACLFAFSIGIQTLFFAMLFDMEANKHLR